MSLHSIGFVLSCLILTGSSISVGTCQEYEWIESEVARARREIANQITEIMEEKLLLIELYSRP
jgi:hypothetical protein